MRHIASHHPPTWTQASPNNVWMLSEWTERGQTSQRLLFLTEIGVSVGKISTLVCQAGKFSYPCWWQPTASDIPCCWGTAGLEELGIILLLGLNFGMGSTGQNQRKLLLLTIWFWVGAEILGTSFGINSPQCNVSAGSLLVLVKSGQSEELVCFLGAGQSSVKICHCAFGPAVLQGTFPMLCPKRAVLPPASLPPSAPTPTALGAGSTLIKKCKFYGTK